MMNAISSHKTATLALADGYQARVDERGREIVDKGIMVQASFNTMCAIEYLKSHNVEPHVIERVLLHPDQRRKLAH